MSSWDKLIKKFLTLKADIRFEEIKKVLESFGYVMKQPKSGSSHYIFRKAGCSNICIPKHHIIKKVYVLKVKEIIEKENNNEKRS